MLSWEQQKGEEDEGWLYWNGRNGFAHDQAVSAAAYGAYL